MSDDGKTSPRVSTFYDERSDVEGELEKVYSSGQCRVLLELGDHQFATVVRHWDRVRPLNDEARAMLKDAGQ